MLPRYDEDLDTALPPGLSYWVPTEREIEDAGDEGLGYFHDTWLIGDVEQEEARDAIAEEAVLIGLLDTLATNADEFDDLATAVEAGEPEDIGIEDVRQRMGWSDLQAAFPEEPGLVTGLELGVGGLSYALAAVGLVPVASCRGHSNPYSWSDSPVVFLATDQHRAAVLQRLVTEHECGLGDGGEGRSDFMTIIGRDIRAMNNLAARNSRSDSTRRRTRRTPRPSAFHGALGPFRSSFPH